MKNLYSNFGRKSAARFSNPIWRILGIKNQLSSEDAKLIETTFSEKLTALQSFKILETHQPRHLLPLEADAADRLETTVVKPVIRLKRKRQHLPQQDDANGTPQECSSEPKPGIANLERRTNAIEHHGIDKSVLTLSEPRRKSDKQHLQFVATQPCLVCARSPSDAHHLRFAQPRAMGRKVSDQFTVPLCRAHHRELHRFGDELAWWRKASLNPIEASQRLWASTRDLKCPHND
jgi:hypothetical protein